jgi:hypothetical protein
MSWLTSANSRRLWRKYGLKSLGKVKRNCRWGNASKSRSLMYCEHKRVRFWEQDGQK